MSSAKNDPFKEQSAPRRPPRKPPIRIDWKQVAGRLAEGMPAAAAAAAAGITEEHLWRHLHASGRFRYWLEQAVERRHLLAELQLGVAGPQALLARALQPAGLDAGLLAALQAGAGDQAEAGTPAGPTRPDPARPDPARPPADRSPAAAASAAGSKVKRQVARLGVISGTAGNMARLARRAAADRAALERIQREKNMVVQLLSQGIPRERLDAAKLRLEERRAARAAASAGAPPRAANTGDAERRPANTGDAERRPANTGEAERSPAKAGEAPRSQTNSSEAPRSPANAGEAPRSPANTSDAPAMPPDTAAAAPVGRLKGYPTYWWSADPWNGSKRPWPRPGEPFPPEDSAPEPAAPEQAPE